MRNSAIFLLVALGCLITCQAEYQDLNLKPLFYFNGNVYLLSNQTANASTAVAQCEAAGYNLLAIQDKYESHNLRRRLMKLKDLEAVWSSGKKTFPSASSPKSEFVWIRGNSSSPYPMTYTDFASATRLANFRTARDRRSVDFLDDFETSDEENASDTDDEKCGRCGCVDPGPPEPNCNNSPNCTITLPECHTKTPPCHLIKPNCTADRGECSSNCPPCEVEPPKCVVTRGPCKVINQECTVREPECTIKTPDCITTRPNCTTIQKPCRPESIEVQIPCPTKPACRINKGKLCSDHKPPCTTYQGPCVSTTAACRNVTDDYGIVVDRICGETTTTCPPPTTTCPPVTTTCRPPIDCSPIYCTSPAKVCEEANTHCPNPITVCSPPVVECKPPPYTCREPIIDCPEPVVNCTKPLAICPGPDVSCPGVVTSCSEYNTFCPQPIVICPPAIINCTKPVPCPEVTPIPLVQATCPPDTTQCDGSGPCTTRRPKKRSPKSLKVASAKQEQLIRPDVDSESYARTECVGLSKEYGFKWDLMDCNKPRRFICERAQKDSSLYNDFTML